MPRNENSQYAMVFPFQQDRCMFKVLTYSLEQSYNLCARDFSDKYV